MSDVIETENSTDAASLKNTSVSEEKQSFWQFVFDLLDDFVMFFVIFMLILVFGVRYAIVSGPSMKQTLHNGDILLLYNFLYTPETGDIIVVTGENKPNDPIVKRVIGTPGDVVNIDYETNEVSVNGVVLDEYYLNNEWTDVMEEQFHMLNYEYPYTVPEGKVFVMGDNRNESSDSRNAAVYGVLDEGNVLGHVFIRIGHISDGDGEGFFERFGLIE